MQVNKWENGRLVECDRLESLFRCWVSCVPGDWERFLSEHEDESKEDQISALVETIKAMKEK